MSNRSRGPLTPGYPLAWLTVTTGSQPVVSSNYWTTNTPQKITVKRVLVAVA